MSNRRRKGSGNGQNESYYGKNVLTILFRISDAVQISYLDRRVRLLTNINHILKIDWKHLICTLREQRTKWGTKNLKFHHDNAWQHVYMSLKKYLEKESQKLSEMGLSFYLKGITFSCIWHLDNIVWTIFGATSEYSLRQWDELSAQITEIVSSISKYENRRAFNKWLEKTQYCLKYYIAFIVFAIVRDNSKLPRPSWSFYSYAFSSTHPAQLFLQVFIV